MTRREWLAALLAGGGALGAGVWWSMPGRAAAAPDEAPWNLSFERPSGGPPLAMASLRGRPLVLNFWATWCEPCLREMPALDRFARAQAGRGWQVFGLAIDSADKVSAFLSRTPVSFPIALGGGEAFKLLRTLGNTQGALPYTVVFGADGGIRQRKAGETRDEDLAAWAAQG